MVSSVAMETIAVDASQHLTAPALFVCSTGMHAIIAHDTLFHARTIASMRPGARVGGVIERITTTTTITTPIRRVRLVVFA